MPVSPPTYSAAYSQSEQNNNAATICGYIDTTNTTASTQKVALHNYIVAVEAVLTAIYSQNQNGRIFAAAQSLLGAAHDAGVALIAATT